MLESRMFYINGRYCHYLALREAFQKLKYPCLQKAGKLLKKCAAYSHPCLQKLINISTRGVQCSSNPCTPQPIPTSSPLFVRVVVSGGICSTYKSVCQNTIHIMNSFSFFKHVSFSFQVIK